MCLIFIAYRAHPRSSLLIAANRDEFHNRPTAAARFWEDAPEVLAGKDLQAGGTWLGITPGGRFAALTNYRDPQVTHAGAPSRGRLISEYLMGQRGPLAHIRHVANEAHRYNGFNLLLGDSGGFFYFSNRSNEVRKLPPGVYGLSNHLLDTAWPKLQTGRAALKRALANEELSADSLLMLLSDRSRPDDAALPDTGIGLEWERFLSPIFISGPEYGTRSSTAVLVDSDGSATFVERSFAPDASAEKTLTFGLQMDGWERSVPDTGRRRQARSER